MTPKDNYIAKLWQRMEDEKYVGFVKRLYSSEIPFRVYATFRYPGDYYGIAFSFDNSIKIDVSEFENLRELKLTLVDDTSFQNSKMLIIELLSTGNRDIFSVLCDNLIQSILPLSTEKEVIKAVINRLFKWKELFDKRFSDGLSLTEQQGLYGELCFLQKFLSHSKDTARVITTWVGVEAATRDFQGSTWAVEVKTNSTNNYQKVIINGERQLDETLLENLFLFHCSLEVSNENGETLNQKIANIRQHLNNDMYALTIFNEKLFEAGYFDEHATKYENRHYQIRKENFYYVRDNFPRIKENELRGGVIDITYSIILAQCNEYLMTEKQLFNIIKI